MAKFQRSFPVIIFLIVNLIALLQIHDAKAATISFTRELIIPLPIFSLSTLPPKRRLVTTTPEPTPPPLPVQEEEVTITAVPDYAPTETTTPTTTAAPETVKPVREDLAKKILDKLDTIEKKVDQLQDDLKKAQTSLTDQKKAIEEVRSKAEEQWLHLSGQIEDGFTQLTLPSTTTTTTTTTVEPFDVDVRSPSFLPKFPSRGLTKNGTDQSDQDIFSLPKSLPSLPSSLPYLSDLSKKLPQIPSLNVDSEPDNPTEYENAPVTSSSSPTDTHHPSNEDNSDLLSEIENYVPDVGLISDDPNHIRFLLYTDPKNPDDYQVLEMDNLTSITSSAYDAKKPVKFLVHGFQQNFNSSYPQNVKNAFLSKRGEEYNVIIVDWGKLSIPNAPYIAPVFYPFAVKNVWRTGVRLGEFISWLKNETLIDLDLVHITGFSLGSHVSGKAASIVQEKQNASISRVTALDPAGPEFYTGIFARKLTPMDATFVDAIHTNAGQLGIWANIAQVDFFINGGSIQPGCIGFDSINAVVRSVTGTATGSCSHNKATAYFANTILDRDVRSEDSVCACTSVTKYKLGLCDCETMILFGAHSNPGTSGTFYLDYQL